MEKGLVKFDGKWLPREEVERIKARVPEDVKRVVTLHLEENKKGNFGAQYFCNPNLATKLFAPTGWEIVNVNIHDGMATVTVRVDSSQKGGSRITTLWDYSLKRMDDDWKISMLMERD